MEAILGLEGRARGFRVRRFRFFSFLVFARWDGVVCEGTRERGRVPSH